MIIGLVLLGLVAIMIFFGFTNKFFRKIGVSNWLAFIVVVALVVGVIVPNIPIGSRFAMNVGGFGLPLVLTFILMIMIGANNNLLRSAISLVAVASVCVSVKMLILPTSMGMEILSAVIIGVVGGGVAYIIARSRVGSIAAAMGGIVLGDVVTALLYYFVTGTSSAVMLGVFGTFDAIIIATVTSIVILEVVSSMRKRSSRGIKGALNTESGDDIMFDDMMDGEMKTEESVPEEVVTNFEDYFDDNV